MIQGLTLVKEKLHLFDVADNLNLLQRQTKPVWVRITTPNVEDVKVLSGLLKFSEEELEDFNDFLKEGARARVEKGKFLEIIYGAPFYEAGDIVTEELAIYVYKNLVITVEPKRITVCETLFSRAKQNRGKYLFKKNGLYLVSELLDEINDRFLTHVNKIESHTDIIASKQQNLSHKQIEAISSASTTLSFFNQVSLANLEVINSLRKMHHVSVSQGNRETFEEIYVDVLQIIDALKIQREIIMNIFNLQSIIASNQMNAFMKKLTAFALIIMIPTLISGIYGMNVQGLPFANSPFGFLIVLVFMFIITIVTFILFKQENWI